MLFPNKLSLSNTISLLHILTFISLYSPASADVVLLTIRNEVDTNKELMLCALKKPFRRNDTNKWYPLVQVKPVQPCISTKEDNSGKAQFIQIDNQITCNFDVFVDAMQANKPGYVLIGSDGPFVRVLLTYLPVFIDHVR